MNTVRPVGSSMLRILLAVISILTLRQSTALAQGTLTPPGPPTPTMKSLDQIEPRIPISSLPFNVVKAGSYYVTTNLFAAAGYGISIQASGVTLDLNGFTLSGTISLEGISIDSFRTNVTVRNGSLKAWDTGVGSASLSRNLVFEGLNISGCNYGIDLSSPALIYNCSCAGNTTDGIFAQGGQIVDCDASDNGSDGILVYGCLVRNCRAANNGLFGIYANPATVTSCWVQNNTGSGIYVNAPGSAIVDNTCIGNNTSIAVQNAGIYVAESNNRIEDNHVSASGVAGITTTSGYTNNIIIKNSVSGNGANNYVTPGNQVVGPLITTYGTITNSNPWANFSF